MNVCETASTSPSLQATYQAYAIRKETGIVLYQVLREVQVKRGSDVQEL